MLELTSKEDNSEYRAIQIQITDLEIYLKQCLKRNNTKEAIVTLFKMFIDNGQIFEVDEDLCVKVIVDYIEDNFDINKRNLYGRGLYFSFDERILYLLRPSLSIYHKTILKKENLLPIEEIIKHVLHDEFNDRPNKWVKDQSIIEVLKYQREKLEVEIKEIIQCIAYDENYNKLRLGIIADEVNSSTEIKKIKELINCSTNKTHLTDLALLYAIDEFKDKRLQTIKRRIQKTRKLVNGFIYAMKNESFKKPYIKVGKTSRHPLTRASELSRNTAVLGKYQVIDCIDVKDITLAEYVIKEILKNKAKHCEKEFFLVGKEDIEKVFDLYKKIEKHLIREYISINNFGIDDKEL